MVIGTGDRDKQGDVMIEVHWEASDIGPTASPGGVPHTAPLRVRMHASFPLFPTPKKEDLDVYTWVTSSSCSSQGYVARICRNQSLLVESFITHAYILPRPTLSTHITRIEF